AEPAGPKWAQLVNEYRGLAVPGGAAVVALVFVGWFVAGKFGGKKKAAPEAAAAIEAGSDHGMHSIPAGPAASLDMSPAAMRTLDPAANSGRARELAQRDPGMGANAA